MVRVHIDETLYADALGVVGWWNGWAVPTFSTEEMERIVSECHRLGWDEDADPRNAFSPLGDGEWLCEGWIWQGCGEEA